MKRHRLLIFLIQTFSLLTLVVGLYVFASGKDFRLKEAPTKSAASSQATSNPTEETSSSSSTTEQSALPAVGLEDWELLLVNRDNRLKEDYAPELLAVGPIMVDHRIADATANFLAAAQAIDPNEHLISGYRSFAEQDQLYQTYLAQELATGLSQEEAEARVQTYSQPAGASEHQTGLAIDLSTVDALNQSDQTVAAQVQAMAPDHGFVLRFPAGKEEVTGIAYEDWHYRYVGVESAKYMTEHKLTLEEYIAQLKEAQ